MAKTAPAPRATPPRPTSATAPEIVDPRWLLKAFGAAVLVALLLGYATLCGLFYRGQWQLVLHPVRTGASPVAIGGTPVEMVRFGAASTGVPQLTGWWIPATPGSPYAQITVLYLRGGDGSLTSDVPALSALHATGVSIFALDYRGYGQSADLHPSQRSMTEDADTAWDYLTGSRTLSGSSIVPYGTGLGAALAVHLAATHGQVPAVVLDEPDFHVLDRVRRDPRSGLVPLGLLFHERFDLRPALDQLTTPKLLLSRGVREDPAMRAAADAKMTVALPNTAPADQYVRTVQRFLDQYAGPTASGTVVPSQPVSKPAP